MVETRQIKASWIGLSLVVVLTICASATASLVNVTASGTVDTVSEPFEFSLDGSVGPGTPCTIRYSYDPTTPDTLPTDATRGKYALSNWSISVGNYIAFDSSNWIYICNDVQDSSPPHEDIDTYGAGGQGDSTHVIGLFFGSASLSGYDSLFVLRDEDPPDAISSDALILPNLSDWASSPMFAIYFVSTEGYDIQIFGSVTTLVPEPTTLLLLGLGGLVLRRKRRTKEF